MTDSYNDLFNPKRMIVIYAKQRNKERGIKILHWLRPLTLEHGFNVMIGVEPESKTPVGPKILCGKRYKISYSQPMILPFYDKEEGEVVFHVAEIEGTLDVSGNKLLNCKCALCDPQDYSHKTTSEADSSIFWLSIIDKIEEVK